MRKAQIQTLCECQADLVATLDEQRLILEAWAIHPMDRKSRETAPARTIRPDERNFDVGWLCPYCGRNTLRTFTQSALIYKAAPEPPQLAATKENELPAGSS